MTKSTEEYIVYAWGPNHHGWMSGNHLIPDPNKAERMDEDTAKDKSITWGVVGWKIKVISA